MAGKTDTYVDEIAIALVLDGHSMSLKGASRAEAIRRMVARGMLAHEMCDRLKIKSFNTLRDFARRYGIKGVTNRREAHWTLHYVERHGMRGNNGKRHFRTVGNQGARTGAREP